MRKFDKDTAIIAVELQQLLADFTHDLDFNDCHGIAEFYAEDGEFAVGDFVHKGRAAIRKFYEERNARVRAQAKDGIRVGTHTFLNVRVHVEDKDHASAGFTNVSYGGEGQPPVRATITPAMITDCRMTFRRDAEGSWRILTFTGKPTFIGDDQFTKASLLKQ